MQERRIPPAALRDPNSVEMLRVWIADKRLHCSIKVGMYAESTKIPEAHAWGQILADVVRHLARALKETEGVPEGENEKAIIDSLLGEVGQPTSGVDGKIER